MEHAANREHIECMEGHVRCMIKVGMATTTAEFPMVLCGLCGGFTARALGMEAEDRFSVGNSMGGPR